MWITPFNESGDILVTINWPLWVTENGLISPEVKKPTLRGYLNFRSPKTKKHSCNYLEHEDPVSYKRLYDENSRWHFFVMKKKSKSQTFAKALIFFPKSLQKKKKKEQVIRSNSWLISTFLTQDFSNQTTVYVVTITVTTVTPLYPFQLEERMWILYSVFWVTSFEK